MSSIVNEVIQLVEAFEKYVSQGKRLLAKTHINTNEELLSFLVELFEKEEKVIEYEHQGSYVTDDHENGVKAFAVALIMVFRKYMTELLECPGLVALFCKRHVAYGYFYVRNTNDIFENIKIDDNYDKLLYRGLVEFYTKFYGKFADNEEAIVLLCKYYPYREEKEIKESTPATVAALYQHVSIAGTPNDIGYAYRGIELIMQYIGRLPAEVIRKLLNEYDIYHVINNRVYRRQILTIIMYSVIPSEEKRLLKFQCLDSLLIGDKINRHFIRKVEMERGAIDDHHNYYDYKLLEERYHVLDDPEAYWDNTSKDQRTLYLEKKPYMKVWLQGENIVVKYMDSRQNRQRVIAEYRDNDWMLETYGTKELQQELQSMVFGETGKAEQVAGQMTFSMVYLDGYRGREDQVLDFDHKYIYDSNCNFIKNKEADEYKITHFYGKSVYSLSCIVGRNATGKTSIIDFLRDTFFRLLKLIDENFIDCENGCVREENHISDGKIWRNGYKDYGILEEGVRFLVIFTLREKDYYLTNIPNVQSVMSVNPFLKEDYGNVNELSKIAYFSNQLRGDQEALLWGEGNKRTSNEEQKKKQEIAKTNVGFRQVNYSEAESFIMRRGAVEHFRRQMEGVPKSDKMQELVNKDICYLLTFLKKVAPEEICGHLDITQDKKLELCGYRYLYQKVIFSLEKLSKEKHILEELEEFIKFPGTVLKYLSAGQYAKLSFLTRLYWFLSGDEEELNHYNELMNDYVFSKDEILLSGETALIFIDEGELYYHPEWQRRYMKTLLDMVNATEVKVQIVLTTNSPFIISDILGEDITYLSEPGKDTAYEITDCTLGQNIHTLLVENFFMEQTIGEYAKELIETMMLCLQNPDETNEEEKRKAKQDMEKYLGRIPESYDDFRFLIEKIGEPVYRHHLMKLLEESEYAEDDKIISALEVEKGKLEKRIEELKRKR